MKAILQGILFFFVSVLTAAPITILPLGDSLTYGVPSERDQGVGGGYREGLYVGLTQSLQSVQMVGPSQENASFTLTAAGQQFHAGFPGYRIDQICDNLDGNKAPWPGNYGGYWLTGIPGVRAPLYPDIILLLAGTNDLAQGAGAPLAVQRYNLLLDKILRLRPNAHVIVAEIFPMFNLMDQVAAFNEGIKGLAAIYKQAGFNVSVVDQYTPFIYYPEHFHDGVHPSDNLIYRLIGYQWVPSVLKEIFLIYQSQSH